MAEWLVESTDDLEQVAQEIKEALGNRKKVALFGEMGAGKTTFVNAFCKQLGITGSTSSPTFSLINDYGYITPDGREAVLHHLDLYRLKSAQEALDIGVEDVLYDPWFCFIEWPQVIEAILPPDYATLHITIESEKTRKINLR